MNDRKKGRKRESRVGRKERKSDQSRMIDERKNKVKNANKRRRT